MAARGRAPLAIALVGSDPIDVARFAVRARRPVVAAIGEMPDGVNVIGFRARRARTRAGEPADQVAMVGALSWRDDDEALLEMLTSVA